MRQVVEKECKKISNIRENLKLQFGRTCHAPLQTGSRVFGQRCLVRVNSISLWLFVQRIIIFSKGCHFDISTRFFCSPDLSPFSVPKSDLPTSYPVVDSSRDRPQSESGLIPNSSLSGGMTGVVEPDSTDVIGPSWQP